MSTPERLEQAERPPAPEPLPHPVIDNHCHLDITRDGDGLDPARWAHDHLYSRAASIYGGTSQIQRNIIAERLLGLPRD